MPGKRRAQTRQKLLDAAFAALAERGFGHVSIEEIAQRAGFTRGAFYSNFASLEEIFFALYEQRARQIAGQVEAALRAAGSAAGGAELVASVADALLIDRDWILVKSDFLLHAARDQRAAAALAGHRRALREQIAAAFARLGRTRGIADPDVQADWLAHAVITIHDGAMYQLLVEPGEQRQREWITELVGALLHAGELPGSPGLGIH